MHCRCPPRACQISDPPHKPTGWLEQTLHSIGRFATVYGVGAWRRPALWRSAARNTHAPAAQTAYLLHTTLNKPEFIDAYKLNRFTSYSRQGQPLVTVCNHASLIDDPSGLSSLVPHSVRISPSKMRWSACSEG